MFTDPPIAPKMVEVLYREVRTRQGQDVDVAPRCADHIKEFFDTQVRISPAVTLVTREPLKLNRSFDRRSPLKSQPQRRECRCELRE